MLRAARVEVDESGNVERLPSKMNKYHAVDCNVNQLPELEDKVYKQLLEDVRNSPQSSSFPGVVESGEFGDSMYFTGPYQAPASQSYDLHSVNSPQPAYPHNIQNSYQPAYSPAAVGGQRSSSVSTTSVNSPYGNTSPFHDSAEPMPMANLPNIPSTSQYMGTLGFQISFGPPTESASKSATWTYSDTCCKLYVNIDSFCPHKFKTEIPPPAGCFLRAVAVFKGSTNLHDVVKRCPNHMENASDGTVPKYHFVKSNNPNAMYHQCPRTQRHSVTVPYGGPQVGTEYVTEMFAFLCFSSCASGPSRRPVEIIFTLEKDGETLGRQVVEIRVCACPGRDRKSDEKQAGGEPSSSQGGKRTKKGAASSKGNSKRRRTNSKVQDEEYTVTTGNPHVYEVLLSMKDKLEEQFRLVSQEQQQQLPTSTSEDDETDRPSSSGAALYKQAGPSSM